MNISKSEEDVLRLEEDKERRVLPKERNFGKKKKKGCGWRGRWEGRVAWGIHVNP